MHEISDVFLNNGVRKTVEGKRSVAERLSSYSNLHHQEKMNQCDSGILNQDYPCDCVACSYLEFKQITGLGQAQQPVPNNYSNSTCSSSGILGEAPPYFACLNRVGGGMDSSVIYSLGLGMQVNIKRTDGRVHTAVVSGINWETKSITVEWFERNETKGKEVDLESIVALNPHIVAGKQSAGPVDSMANVTANLNVMPTPSNPRQTVISEMRPPAEVTASITKTQIPSSNLMSNNSTGTNNQGGAAVGKIPRARQTQMLNPTKIEPVGINDIEENMEVTPHMNGGSVGGTVTRGDANNKEMGPPASRRRSNVVKEVEKLKKNREERRLRQAEIKNEKENMMNMDPGNPNWEFLSMIREYRHNLEFSPLRDTDPVEDHQITVCVRKRPMNKKETTRKEVDVITVPNKNQISVHEPKQKVDLTKYLENQHFRFDYAFDESCSNEIVYKYTARHLIQTVFDGGMATCFAYGQTGSGKTHTMGGDFNGKTQDCQKGIYAMTAKDVFRFIKSPPYRTMNLSISCSFFEIYSGKVFDLLAQKAKLRVLEDGKQQVQVVGLTERAVDSQEDVLKLIQLGNAARTSGQTSANSNSSRSHAVFQIILRQGPGRLHGKFSLIDLAGNERGADTSSADRQTRMEGAEINKSLLALKECIRALGRKGAHLPFRASKLTQVLRDSFIGEKSKTCMIAMISPGLSSCEHSLNTLRYADRVKELAAHDPMEVKMSAVAEDDDDDVENMESESDLAQLRSLNEGEMSGDMLTFHEAISKLQEAEEDMVEYHKLVMDSNNRWYQQDKYLLDKTNQVEYDQEAYTIQLDELIMEKISMLTELRQKVGKFRNMLTEEETVSKKMTNSTPNSRR